MRKISLRLLLLVVIAAAGTACESTAPSRPATRHSHSHTEDNRPFNLQQRQFEDPTSPGHRTSPGDAR